MGMAKETEEKEILMEKGVGLRLALLGLRHSHPGF